MMNRSKAKEADQQDRERAEATAGPRPPTRRQTTSWTTIRGYMVGANWAAKMTGRTLNLSQHQDSHQHETPPRRASSAGATQKSHVRQDWLRHQSFDTLPYEKQPV
eukprot:TRINITY_DN71545_c0_g1_i1.p1 TRINITY_DN71545_c0_g1~~TRINITY_DN71545_c0_g1_i1.p1  ORF type:complete len:106 (+),score=14.36 TRINITY_DN71545_c0_g1_i1:92-409(+)